MLEEKKQDNDRERLNCVNSENPGEFHTVVAVSTLSEFGKRGGIVVTVASGEIPQMQHPSFFCLQPAAVEVRKL